MTISDFKRKETGAAVLRLEEQHVPMLLFPILEKTGMVRHGFTTRGGGTSGGIWRSLNLSFSRGDSDEDVRENFSRVASALGVSMDRFVFSDQTHTSNLRVVTEEDAGKGLTLPRDYSDIDGLVTNVPGLVLSIFTADCVPVFFVDPVRRAIGLSHAGWRGTAEDIAGKTVRLMSDVYGSDPSDIICAIAPSICADCYEISRDVAEVFAEKFAGRETEILTSPLQERDGARVPVTEVLKGTSPDDKFHLDLWKSNSIMLEKAGVKPEHISVTDICTCCNPDLLFSHRASHGRRGNLGAFLLISETH